MNLIKKADKHFQPFNHNH